MTRPSFIVFEHSLQKVEAWIKDLMVELQWGDVRETFLALKAVMQTLRDRLPLQEALHLGAHMPTLIRGLYLENWDPEWPKEKIRTREEFFDYVLLRAKDAPWILEVESVVRAVFKVICKYAAEGEAIHVINSLPQSLRELWPEQFQDLARQYYQGKSGYGPKNFKRSDELIGDDIFKFLHWYGQIGLNELEFYVENGIVTLQGTVENGRIRRGVEERLEMIPGVREIRNQLAVRSVPERPLREEKRFHDRNAVWQGGTPRR